MLTARMRERVFWSVSMPDGITRPVIGQKKVRTAMICLVGPPPDDPDPFPT
jgi:hypothetical protein